MLCHSVFWYETKWRIWFKPFSKYQYWRLGFELSLCGYGIEALTAFRAVSVIDIFNVNLKCEIRLLAFLGKEQTISGKRLTFDYFWVRALSPQPLLSTCIYGCITQSAPVYIVILCHRSLLDAIKLLILHKNILSISIASRSGTQPTNAFLSSDQFCGRFQI